MSNTRTSKQIAKDYEDKMGAELGGVFYLIYNEIIYLHQLWNTYKELYTLETSRINIMNSTAPFYFYLTQKGLFENIILSIARLTDPMKTRQFKNFTLNILPSLINDDKLRNEIELGLKEIVLKSVVFAREYRSKIYAHRDYDIKLGTATLEGNASIENIEMALQSIRDLMDKITMHYEYSTTDYQNSIHSGDGRSLLFILEKGLNCSEYIEMKRINGDEINDVLTRSSINHKNVRFEGY